ncbi:hepatitis A virus cellular receptor 1-like [Eurosta solidaginis]|uniref:hepatitis A virus cellular receptor 1-like n=1 Tax=Eurosta solidaginis TaxID=178769 RepID=UPI00353094EB
MLWPILCYKLYFWPFLNYLAALKGICPLFPGFLPIFTLTPVAMLTLPTTTTTSTTTAQTTTTTTATITVTTTTTAITTTTTLATTTTAMPTTTTTQVTAFPGSSTTTTLASTQPTTITTQPTTLLPCPAQPLVCLNFGIPPIPNCPCIDPRKSGLTRQANAVVPSSDQMVFSSINTANNGAPNFQQQQVYTSSNPYSYTAGAAGANGAATYVPPNGLPPGSIGSDIMVFSSLNGRRRRRRKRRMITKLGEGKCC